MNDKTELPAVAITFSIEAKINQGRSIVAQTAIARDASTEDINGLLDKVTSALDRQEAKALIKGLQITLERDEKSLANTIEAVAKLEESYRTEWSASGRRGSFELRGQQKTNIDNQRKSVETMKERIETIKRDINELQQVAA